MNKGFWVIVNTSEHRRIPGEMNYVRIHDVEDPSKQGFMDWTSNIDDAVQFARQVDGERFANVYFWADRKGIEVQEHAYMDMRHNKRFPILGTDLDMPWEIVMQHRHAIIRHHGQTLDRLAERGGP